MSTQSLTKFSTDARDIIAIGGSSGAIDAVKEILEQLPKHLNASIFIVIHGGVTSPEFLADIFGRCTLLKVSYAEDREPIELNRVYVAPGNRHLLVKPGEMRVVRGPKENGFRPAIDPLLRTAAQSYDGRVLGVVLSGLLDDGTQGLLHVKQFGGMAVAQSPEDAHEINMPTSAIRNVEVDFILSAVEIGKLIAQIADQSKSEPASAVHDNSDVVEGIVSGLQLNGGDSPSSPFICPDCGGALWQIVEGNLLRYRCHVGHGYSANTLLAQQSVEIEQSLWSAVRMLEEQAVLHQRMADRSQKELRGRFLENAAERRQTADLIRSLLTGSHTTREATSNVETIRHEYLK